MNADGIITKGIGGFYYVQTDSGLVECRARGKFRKEGITPLVGDRVTITIEEEQEGQGLTGAVEHIAPRKNSFVRPPVANIDQLLVTMACTHPTPDLMLVDKLLATARHEDVSCVLCINKTDLDSGGDADSYREIYQKAGFPVLCLSAAQGDGLSAVRELLAGKITALAGNSGVGKSSILRALGLNTQTGSISQKIKRGKQTTRHVELMELAPNSYVLDTPGFSSFEVDYLRHTELEELFPEFAPYLGKCRFQGCAHIGEPDCAVKEAVQEGHIAPSRHQNYTALYNTLKEIKEWMR